jgi:hypothetical protein
MSRIPVAARLPVPASPGAGTRRRGRESSPSTSTCAPRSSRPSAASTPGTARAEALRQFGDVDDARRYIRALDARTDAAARRRETMNAFLQDPPLRRARLRRAPGLPPWWPSSRSPSHQRRASIVTLVDAALLRRSGRRPGALVASATGRRGRDVDRPAADDVSRTRCTPTSAPRARGASRGLLAVGRTDVSRGPARRGHDAARRRHPASRSRCARAVSGNYFAVPRRPGGGPHAHRRRRRPRGRRAGRSSSATRSGGAASPATRPPWARLLINRPRDRRRRRPPRLPRRDGRGDVRLWLRSPAAALMRHDDRLREQRARTG